jgi:hypothetical protein
MLILTWKSFFLAAIIAAVTVHCTSSSSELWHDDDVKKEATLSIAKKEKAAPQDHEFTMLTADDPEISEFREAFAFSRLLPPEAPVSNRLVCLKKNRFSRATDVADHIYIYRLNSCNRASNTVTQTHGFI